MGALRQPHKYRLCGCLRRDRHIVLAVLRAVEATCLCLLPDSSPAGRLPSPWYWCCRLLPNVLLHIYDCFIHRAVQHCRPPLSLLASASCSCPCPAQLPEVKLAQSPQPCCRLTWLVSIPATLLQANLAHCHFPNPAAGELGPFPFPQPCRLSWLISIFPNPAADQLGPTQLLGLLSHCPPTSFWRGSCSRHMPALQRRGTLQPSRPAIQRTASTMLPTSLVGPLYGGFTLCSCILTVSWWLASGGNTSNGACW